jgi:alkylation response protein AidB-like acyl-CoA dehydrogenase
VSATLIDSGAGSGYRIDGTKDRVEAAAQSDALLVVARCGPGAGEVRQFLVPTDAPGVRIVPRQSVDLVKRYARVHFDGVVVEPAAAVGWLAARAPAGAHVRDFRTLYGALGYPSRAYFGSTADEVTDLAAYTGQEDPIYQEINGYLRFYPAPYEWYGTSPAQ